MTIRRGDSIIAGNAGGIPSQTGQSGKFLTTNGTTASWGDTVDYTNITNYITEIPQDIKLELNNVTLKLKAGSKAYVPNGFEADGTTPKFDVKIIESDIIVGSPYIDGPMFIYYMDNTVVPVPRGWSISGTSNTITDNFGCWYDTTNNIIKIVPGDEVGSSGMSLPLAIVNGSSDGDWTSIDQVFNGFGYIGSTVFALPGVKGLIPNGRNEDGSLKSIEFTVDSVKTYTTINNMPTELVGCWCIQRDNNIGWDAGDYWTYDKQQNLFLHGSEIFYKCDFAYYLLDSNRKIASFTPKTAFHAVDYNEFAPVKDAIPTKQDVATAVNYNNISNCITEIPQDIKLELNNGTLTLKAGSKVYIPNGAGKFDEVIVSSDINLAKNSSGLYFVFMKSNGVLSDTMSFNYCYSSNSQPTITHTYAIWYDTANNKIKWTGDNGSTWTEGYSLPMCIVVNDTPGTQNVSSIDQVFNGFGYIGSTVFALPGVKGLIPNGRNADGSLKSIEFTVNRVLTKTYTSGTYARKIVLTSNNIEGYTKLKYDELSNYNIDNGVQKVLCDAGTYITDNGKITSFTPKTVFHAVDYNDFSDLKNTVGIPSQTGQSGKFLTTNGTTTSWAAVNVDTSDIYNKIDTKQDKSTAVNYNNISNCITEIPQDIKLELNNGVLTLKAGSKVYIPNDAEVFDTLNIASDITLTLGWRTAEKCVLCIYGGNSLVIMSANRCVSGSSDSISGNDHWYYNTTNNTIRFVNGDGTTRQTQMSLPIAIITMAGDGTAKVNSIDQVFNGFGYIGSTVFALPGVKGRIPNGRNADGSLKNLLSINNSVQIYTLLSSETEENIPIYVNHNGSLFRALKHIYDEKNNFNLNFGNINYCYVGPYVSYTNGKITSFTPKTVFHALDYNDFSGLKDTKVSKSGDTMSGTLKNDGVFVSQFDNVNYIARSKTLVKGVTPTDGNKHVGYDWQDKNRARLAYLGVAYRTDGVKRLELQKLDNNLSEFNISYRVKVQKLYALNGGDSINISRGDDNYTEIKTITKNGVRTGGFRNIVDSGNKMNECTMYVASDDGTSIASDITIGKNIGGGTYTRCPKPADNSNTYAIATTNWAGGLKRENNWNGLNTFQKSPETRINGNARYKSVCQGYTKGTAPTTNQFGGVSTTDKNGVEVAALYSSIDTNNTVTSALWVKQPTTTGTAAQLISIYCDKNGNFYTYAPQCKAANSIVTTIAHSTNYVRFGNGLQICWGSGTGVQVFPQPFKDANYMIADSDLTYHKYEGVWTSDKTTTQFKINNSGNAQWVAIGYWY